MLKMYTTTWCPDCVAAKNVLRQRQVHFEEVNIERDPQAAEFVMSVNGGRRSVPTLVLNGDVVSLSRFSRGKLDSWLDKHGLLQSSGASSS
jgi:mycoredoxin